MFNIEITFLENVLVSTLKPRNLSTAVPLPADIERAKRYGSVPNIRVRKLKSVWGQYEIVTGEMEYRTALAAQHREIGIEVVDWNDEAVIEAIIDDFRSLGLATRELEDEIEEETNPIADALFYQQELEKLAVGVRPYVRAQNIDRRAKNLPLMNHMRIQRKLDLLKLPLGVQQFVKTGQITPFQAYPLARLDHVKATELATRILKEDLSGRAVQEAVQHILENEGPGTSVTSRRYRNANQQLADTITEQTSYPAKVAQTPNGKATKITLTFFSNDEIEGFKERIGVCE